MAVKALRRADPESQLRFAREARVLGSLSHPGVVRYVADGESESGEVWLATEWLEGEDLGTRLGRGALSGNESVSVARGIADALSYAHGLGLVHRDIKPSNVWLLGGAADAGVVKLLDFGVVRRTESRASLLVTRAGLMLGTPGYMSPEQARGESDVDARADLYGLGCVLFECLTGRPAHLGDQVLALLAKVGVGKSRVRQEWVRALAASQPEVLVCRAHADVMHERAAYGVASRLVRDGCGVPFGASAEQVRRAILEAVTRVVEEKDRWRIASRLSELCGAPWDEDVDEALVTAREDAIVMGDQLRAAWEDFLVASCRERAVVLVVELMEAGSRDYLARILAAAGAPRRPFRRRRERPRGFPGSTPPR